MTNPILDSLAEQTAGKLVQTRVLPVDGGINVEVVGSMTSLLSRQLVEGVVNLLCHVTLG